MQTLLIEQLTRTLRSIEQAVPDIEREVETSKPEHQKVIAESFFRPQQDQQIKQWFTRFLTLRDSLWEVIDRAQQQVPGGLKRISARDDYRLFVVGFVAACLVVRLDRLLLEQVATDSIIQRKLNEGIPEHNIPRKQYTRIFESFIDVSNTHRIYQAIRFANRNRTVLADLSDDNDVGYFVTHLPRFRACLDESKRNYFKRLMMFLRHACRRKGATIKQHTQFGILEASGRVVSELVGKGPKLVTGELRELTRKILQPGDILVTRHRYAMTNFFLPGFWPHSAVYVGTNEQRDSLNIQVSDSTRLKWKQKICTFEALKDGVLFRTLENTLKVDSFVVLRPSLTNEGVRQAIQRAIVHEGKQYNFDFDFFRSDRLVCTEVVYRAFDGIEGIQFQLNERAGRPTLAAEDLCDLALDTEMFDVVAICGIDGADGLIADQPEAAELLRRSYRKTDEID